MVQSCNEQILLLKYHQIDNSLRKKFQSDVRKYRQVVERFTNFSKVLKFVHRQTFIFTLDTYTDRLQCLNFPKG